MILNIYVYLISTGLMHNTTILPYMFSTTLYMCTQYILIIQYLYVHTYIHIRVLNRAVQKQYVKRLKVAALRVVVDFLPCFLCLITRNPLLKVRKYEGMHACVYDYYYEYHHYCFHYRYNHHHHHHYFSNYSITISIKNA